MRIIWEVDDSYVGHRPQHSIIPDSEFDDCGTEKEKQDIINEWVQNDFEQKISWSIISVE